MITMQWSISIPKEKPQKASTNLSNLCVDETNMNTTLGAISKQVPYIRYSTTFWEKSMLAFFNSWSELNTIYHTFVKELDLQVRVVA